MCTGRCLGGGEGREGYFSPSSLFIGSLTTARTAAAPPLSCLPRLPPLSPSAVRRNSMPIRFGARRQRDQRRAAALEGAGWGSGLCLPQGRGTLRVSRPGAQGQTGRPRPPHEGARRAPWGCCGGQWREPRRPAGHHRPARAGGWRWFPGGRGL